MALTREAWMRYVWSASDQQGEAANHAWLGIPRCASLAQHCHPVELLSR